MGTVGDALDNAVAKSFFATLQIELLDRRPSWASREHLARATFDYIECLYNPVRRHSTLRGLHSSSSNKPAPPLAASAAA